MTTKNETMSINRPAGATSGLVVLFVLAAAGVGAWIYQLTQGMAVTGLGQQVVWAMYIAAFFSAVGAGAGMLFLVGLSEFAAFIPQEKRRMGLMAALASFVAGGLLIMLDIGNPAQVWRIMTAFRFSSMMTWDFWLLVVAGVAALAYLFLAKEGKKPVLGILGMAAAAAVVVVEGWMLSSMSARPLWEGGATVVSFLLAALLGGLALWILVKGEIAGKAESWFKVVLTASLVMVAAEVISRLVGGSPRATEEIAGLVISGTAAPTFWFQILVGLALPLGLVAAGKNIKLAAALALLGVLAEKSWLLIAGQATPWMKLPEGTYFFSWVEAVAVIGVAAIGVLVFFGLKKVLDK